MFNPFLKDLTKLKEEDLHLGLADITKKYNIASKLPSTSQHLLDQLIIAMQAYKDEQLQRQNRALDTAFKKQDKSVNKLINIR